MYLLKYSKLFKKGLKRTNKRKNFDINLFKKTLGSLCKYGVLSKKYKPHKLHGKLKDYYACHLEPDLVLIYQKDKENKIIYLLRIGSHSELF